MSFQFIRDITRKCGIVSFLFILSACTSQTSVHLYAKYLSNKEIQKLKQNLEEQEYNVEVNTYDFPTSINGNTLLHSLLIRNPQAPDIVRNIAQKSGFEIKRVQALTKGNHWYTKDTLAIFALPESIDSKQLLLWQDLTHQYKTTECDKPITLTLNKSGTYDFSGEDWTEQQLKIASGTWHYRQYPYLELRPYKGENWNRYFEIKQYVDRDKVSEIEMLRLQPLQPHHLAGNCHFIYGTRILLTDI